MDLLSIALGVTPPDASTLDAWWQATSAERSRWPVCIERAVIGGALADRVGFAFAVGYHEALQALVPGLHGQRASLCASEEGGNHPRAIKTSLTRVHDQGYELTGKKSWATVAGKADRLLVIASVGGNDVRNSLVMASVRADAPGVTITPSSAPFVPEIPHASVTFDKVAVADADVHPGDGYDLYLKPFRTVEDIHVHGALLGYVLGVAKRHGFAGELGPLIAAAIDTARMLGGSDATLPSTHLSLAGLLEQTTKLVTEIETRWPAGDERARWDRDRPLLKVASSARAARLAKAKQELGL